MVCGLHHIDGMLVYVVCELGCPWSFSKIAIWHNRVSTRSPVPTSSRFPSWLMGSSLHSTLRSPSTTSDSAAPDDLSSCITHTLNGRWQRVAARVGVWGWQVGRPPQAPLLRGPHASGLWVCQAIFSGKLEMLIHVPFKILLQGQIP